MEYLSKNVEALLAFQEGFSRAELEESYKGEEENIRKASAVSTAQARDGSRILLYQRNGKEYRLNSSYRPQAEAEKWAAQYSCSSISQCFVFYGLGNGIFLRSLLKNCREDAKVLVYEPEKEIFLHVLMQQDIADVIGDSRVALHVENVGGVPIYRLLDQYVTKENEKLLTLCVHPQYENLFPEGLLRLKKEIEDLKGRLTAAENTKKAFGRRIVKNTCYAWKRYAADENAMILSKELLEQSGREELLKLRRAVTLRMPAVLLATGPSLAKSIEPLKKLQGKAVFFAVDSSVRYLLGKGIQPDYLVTIDPLKWPKHFQPERCRKLPVFCRFDSNFKILEEQGGPMIFFGGTEYARMLAGEEVLFVTDTGGSVATAAFSLCQAIGFSEIILVGQDLCYDGEKTHAGGIISPDEKKQGFGKKWIPGNLEEKVQTRQDWYRYLKWFENEIFLHPECKVINATAGGAKIKGTEWESLETIAEKLQKAEDSGRIEGNGYFSEKRSQQESGRSRMELTGTSGQNSAGAASEASTDSLPGEQHGNSRIGLQDSQHRDSSKDLQDSRHWNSSKDLQDSQHQNSSKDLQDRTAWTKQEISKYLEGEPELLAQLKALISQARRDCETLKNTCRLPQLTIEQWKAFLAASEENQRVSGLIAQLEELPVYYLLDLLLPEETTSGMYQLTGNPMEDEYQTWYQMEKFFAALGEALKVLGEIEAEVQELTKTDNNIGG